MADGPMKKLSFLNRYLTLWIFIAIFLGIGLGATVPGIAEGLNALSIGTTSIPIAIGLILMMWPPLARVKYEELREIPKQPEAKKMLGTSPVLNYVVGPLLMFALAWIFLPDNVGSCTEHTLHNLWIIEKIIKQSRLRHSLKCFFV